jgi:hypothetical protein
VRDHQVVPGDAPAGRRDAEELAGVGGLDPAADHDDVAALDHFLLGRPPVGERSEHVLAEVGERNAEAGGPPGQAQAVLGVAL